MVPFAARLAASPAFDRAILAVILANAVVLGAETYDGVRSEYGGLLDGLNAVFLAVFVVELVIRFLGSPSPRAYLRDGWNVFDLVVVSAAFVPGLRENATLVRIARLLRVFRAVRLLPDLRVLVVAVGRSLPGVASLAILTVLLLFAYGMLGWVLFADAQPDRFGDVGEAMLTLFVLLSLEGLPEAIADGRAVTDWAIVFYLSFTILAAFLLFNLFIGIVITSLEEARALELRRAERDLLDEDPGNDAAAREIVLGERVRTLRAALDDLEREVAAPARGARP